jgi:peptidoglycan/LPS O-acetylase OafA/YrhL
MSATATTALSHKDLQAIAPARPASVAAPASRLALLDGTRLLAAVGIIWVHSAQSALGLNLYPIGTFGVPFYILVAVLFMTRSLTRAPDASLRDYVASRFSRVYVPFLAWTGVYLALNQAKSLAVDGRIAIPPWTTIYAGSQQHLWFLPYLMVVTIVGGLLVRLLRPRSRLRRIAVAAFLCAAAYLCWVPEPAWIATRHDAGDMEFWRYAFRALPTVFMALAIALAVVPKASLPRSNTTLAIGGMVLFSSALILEHESLIGPIALLRMCAGIGILLVALWPVIVPMIERLGSLGRYSYGVYLSHVVFIRIVVLWAERFDVKPSIWLDLFTFAFALVGALALSVLLSKSKYTRWTLGE